MPQRFVEPLSKSEIAIELSGPYNESILFPPAGKVLRGEYLKTRLPRAVHFREDSGLSKVDRVPGTVIALDISGKRGRYFDPLGTEDNWELLRQISADLRGNPTELIAEKENPLANMSDDQVATWFHWMLRAVTDGTAKVLDTAAKWPEKPPAGRIRVDFFSSDLTAPRYKDQFEKARRKMREQQEA
jgi:hypothetical protein